MSFPVMVFALAPGTSQGVLSDCVFAEHPVSTELNMSAAMTALRLTHLGLDMVVTVQPGLGAALFQLSISPSDQVSLDL